jgi:hypothetical protein
LSHSVFFSFVFISVPLYHGTLHVIYERIRYWSRKEILGNVFELLQKREIISIRVRILAIDSTRIKVHPDGHGAFKKTESKLSEKLKEASTQTFIWFPRLFKVP